MIYVALIFVYGCNHGVEAGRRESEIKGGEENYILLKERQPVGPAQGKKMLELLESMLTFYTA